MKREYLDYMFKLFMSASAFLFWQIQVEVQSDINEVQKDVKSLLQNAAANEVEIASIKQRIERLESSAPVDGVLIAQSRQYGTLPESPTIKRRN